MTVAALQSPARRFRLLSWRWMPVALVAAVALTLMLVEPPDWLTTFATVFLGVLFEALPFLLLGVLVSAGVQTWLTPSLVQRLVPAGRLRGALAGALFGAAFPVCECGVVPVARRLLAKGASVPVALGLLLAGPVANPVVFFATWTALGLEMAVARMVLAVGIAVAVAWLYGLHPAPASLLRVTGTSSARGGQTSTAVLNAPMLRVLASAGDELLEMGAYLAVGAAAAATLRTLVPGSSLIDIGQGPVISVAAMMLLAALLSICSMVDAFVALSFTSIASSGALLAFLVFGPVVDVKSIVLYGALFRWRTVLMLVLLLTELALLAGVAINLNLG